MTSLQAFKELVLRRYKEIDREIAEAVARNDEKTKRICEINKRNHVALLEKMGMIKKDNEKITTIDYSVDD